MSVVEAGTGAKQSSVERKRSKHVRPTKPGLRNKFTHLLIDEFLQLIEILERHLEILSQDLGGELSPECINVHLVVSRLQGVTKSIISQKWQAYDALRRQR